MVRLYSYSAWSTVCFPHARGDGPVGEWFGLINYLFSPRPWGWSDLGSLSVIIFMVFPTPVGMVRLFTSQLRAGRGFPHARGDGPIPNIDLSALE